MQNNGVKALKAYARELTPEEERAAAQHSRQSMNAAIRDELRFRYVQRGTEFNFTYGFDLPGRIANIRDGGYLVYSVKVPGEYTYRYYSNDCIDDIPPGAVVLFARSGRDKWKPTDAERADPAQFIARVREVL